MKKIVGKEEILSIPKLMSGNNLSLVCPANEISIYFHFPFCKRICPYCHFYVVKSPTDPFANWQSEFVSHLIQDLYLHKQSFENKTLRSIYFGGGTPSLFEAHFFKKILEKVSDLLPISHSTEITLEANPEAISSEALATFYQAGINRISLGVQSLEDNELIRLGRGHKSSKALEAISLIQKSPISNYSLDLMMETPGQTAQSWQKTLSQIREINPPHLSLYNLVIEPGTAYAKQEKRLRKQMVEAHVATEMLETACKTFEEAGLNRYEISAFCHIDHESIHNTGYWRGRDFIGIGPSAFSFFQGQRLQKHCDLKEWEKNLLQGKFGWGLIDDPSEEIRQAELLAVHLRLVCGTDIDSFEKRWGPLNQELKKAIQIVIDLGWLQKKDSVLKLTPEGRLFYDRLASELMPV